MESWSAGSCYIIAVTAHAMLPPACHLQGGGSQGQHFFGVQCRTQGLACSLGAAAEGDVDYWAAQPPPKPIPTPPTNHTWHTLSSPGPSRGGDQALLDRGIHQRHRIP